MKETFRQYVQDVQDVLGIVPTIDGSTAEFTSNGIWLCSVVHNPGGAQWSESCTVEFGNSSKADLDYAYLSVLAERLKPLTDLARQPAVAPTQIVVELVSYDYNPGDQWGCDVFNFTANTSLGQIVWEETIPGPCHDSDSHEVTVTLNGVSISDSDLINRLPDFEAPERPGRWARCFESKMDTDIPETLAAWLEANKQLLVRLVPLPSAIAQTEGDIPHSGDPRP